VAYSTLAPAFTKIRHPVASSSSAVVATIEDMVDSLHLTVAKLRPYYQVAAGRCADPAAHLDYVDGAVWRFVAECWADRSTDHVSYVSDPNYG
jgi:hypothetical protein